MSILHDLETGEKPRCGVSGAVGPEEFTNAQEVGLEKF